MEDIILTKKQLEKLPLLHEKSEGIYGQVVVYKDGLIKRFKDDIDSNMKKNIEENIKRQSPIFLYPKCKVYEKNNENNLKLRGYFMDEAPGIDLLRLRNGILSGKNDMAINDFLTIYYDKLLPLLLHEDMLMLDMKLCQMFIDDNFYFVDTDPFYKSNIKILRDYNFNSAYEWNLKEINSVITGFFDMIFNYKVDSNLEYKDDNYINNYLINVIRITKGKAKSFRQAYKMLDDQKKI